MLNGLINDFGYKYWYKNDKYHREDGPAIEYPNGYKAWLQNGLHHREDGPAIECQYGDSWYYKGKKINCSSQKEFEKIIKLKPFW